MAEGVRRHDPVRRAQPGDQVGQALARVGDPVQEQQDGCVRVAVLVHEQPSDTSLGDDVTGSPVSLPRPHVATSGKCEFRWARETTDLQTGRHATEDRHHRPRRPRGAARVRPAAPPRDARHHPQERPAAGLAGHLRRRRGGPGRHLDLPARAKVANLRRDPAATVLIHSDDWDGPYVQVDGTAEVIDLPDAVEPLVDYFRSISGEHPDWDEYRQAMREQGKSLIRVTIEPGARSPPAASRPSWRD